MTAIRKTPAYLLHKATGQARVRIDGKDHYLGPFNSAESRERYDELVTAWLRREEYSQVTLNIDDLVLLYLDFARGYYVKHGTPTSEIHDIRGALRPLVKRFGRLRVREFSPLKLKAVRDDMVAIGWTRKTVNAQVKRIRRMFRWGTENEHVPPEVLTALAAVACLKEGRTTAKDLPPILPVDDQTIDATLPHLSIVVADMVRLQRVTGMRPQEICLMRPCDIDRTGIEWSYRPSRHKTEHKGRSRVVFIGPQGQEILTRYLLRAADAYCFSPAEAERQRRANLHETRKTPLDYGNRPGTNRTESPQRRAGNAYDHNSYRRAIHRACDQAFPVPAEMADDLVATEQWREAHRWSPNQLRHSFATVVRKQFGLEAAQVLLGHAKVDMTQDYAEKDMDKARAIAGIVG